MKKSALKNFRILSLGNLMKSRMGIYSNHESEFRDRLSDIRISQSDITLII
jgi:hypothetical protein